MLYFWLKDNQKNCQFVKPGIFKNIENWFEKKYFFKIQICTENELTEKIGMRVILNNKKNNSGSLTFEYKALDQLDRLINTIKEIINNLI